MSLAEPPAVMHNQDLLGPLLKRVSRSFYLTLRAVPGDLRRPIGLAYLLARAADTIADTALIGRDDRLKHLELFRDVIREGRAERLSTIQEALVQRQQIAAERELLTRLDEGFALLASLTPSDQIMVRDIVLTLTEGMVMDLATFPGEDEGRLVALETRADLDRYTYYVAGCVGEFWTDIHLAHRPSLAGWDREVMRRRGVRFGKGLQMTNVLRDLPKDLRIGRCYLPQQELNALGLQPADLLDPSAITKVKPLLRSLLALALEHYQEGWAYTLAIPRHEFRMRLACVLPLFIGLKTLALLARSPNLLDPNVVIKVSRGAVYGIMARSLVLIGSDTALDRYYQQLYHNVLGSPSPVSSPPMGERGGGFRMMAEHKHVRAHVLISGRVQGVCFRAYTVDEAAAAGITGWARNTPDGRVEAVFEGEQSAVEAMIAWCHKGPPAARVSNVEVVWGEPKGEQGFGIRR